MSTPRQAHPPSRVVLHLAERRRRVLDAEEIYYLEAQGDDTDVRLRRAQRLRDVRPLGELLPELEPLGFVRVHRNHAVNIRHVREFRPAKHGGGWDLRLAPPVHKVLPMSRAGYAALLAAPTAILDP